MSLKSATYWTVVCDRCGKDGNESSDYAAYFEEEGALEVAAEWDDWIVVELEESDTVEHFCADCWEYDEEEHGYVAKPPLELTIVSSVDPADPA